MSFSENYSQAREYGLLPPLAVLVALGFSARSAAGELAERSPLTTLTVFLAAYIAAAIGPLAAVVVAALLIGIHFARPSSAAVLSSPRSTLIIPGDVQQAERSPFEQLTAAGLECSKVEFRKPPQQRKAAAAP